LGFQTTLVIIYLL